MKYAPSSPSSLTKEQRDAIRPPRPKGWAKRGMTIKNFVLTKFPHNDGDYTRKVCLVLREVLPDGHVQHLYVPSTSVMIDMSDEEVVNLLLEDEQFLNDTKVKEQRGTLTRILYTGERDNRAVRELVEDRTVNSGSNSFFVVGDTKEGLLFITDLGRLSVLPGDCIYRKEGDHRVWVSRLVKNKRGRITAEQNSL